MGEIDTAINWLQITEKLKREAESTQEEKTDGHNNYKKISNYISKTAVTIEGLEY